MNNIFKKALSNDNKEYSINPVNGLKFRKTEPKKIVSLKNSYKAVSGEEYLKSIQVEFDIIQKTKFICNRSDVLICKSPEDLFNFLSSSEIELNDYSVQELKEGFKKVVVEKFNKLNYFYTESESVHNMCLEAIKKVGNLFDKVVTEKGGNVFA